jgi:hypothetical protein
MAFGHGKSTTVYANGCKLTDYLNSIETSISADTAETTTFGLTAKTYVAGVKDATLSGEGFFDGSAGAVDEVLAAALASESVEWTWYPQGDTLNNYGYAMLGINTNYTVTSTIDDAAKISVESQSIVGAERVQSLHALATRTSTWTGTTQDNGALSSNGGSAYLQVTAATGTIEVSIRHSDDDFDADDEELVAFTAVTGVTSQRVTFTGTVNRYVRGTATLAGGESITFNMAIHRD